MSSTPTPQRKPLLRTWWSKLSVEYRVLIPFVILWIVGVLAGLPINQMTFSATINVNFVGPMLLGTLIQIVFTVLYSRRAASKGRNKQLMILSIPFVLISVFLYFNFKAWMPFVHPRLYDPDLQQLDMLMQPLLDAILGVRRFIARVSPFNPDIWYGLFFFGMFFFSLTLHTVLDTTVNYRRVVLGMCLNLLIGGVSYWIMPSLGPFLYRVGESVVATDAQSAMYDAFVEVKRTRVYPPGYFTAPLGAMPSLHVGHTVFFTLCIARSLRPFLVFYVPITLWMMIEAVGTSYHYILDIPAGIALALLTYALSTRLIPDRKRASIPAAAPQAESSLEAA